MQQPDREEQQFINIEKQVTLIEEPNLTRVNTKGSIYLMFRVGFRGKIIQSLSCSKSGLTNSRSHTA